ncbi:MAG TPA: oligosaccharide flippase family protein [Ardenticatenaceae bacterium]
MHLLSLVRSRPILWNMAALLGGSAGAQLFLAAATLLTARILGRDAYGQYAACFALAALTSTVFTFGMDQWLLQRARDSRTELDGHMTNSLLVRLLVGLPWFIGLGLLAPRLNPSAYPRDLMWVMAGTVWADGLLAACLSAFKATLRNHVTSFLMAGQAGALLLATLALMRYGDRLVLHFAGARLLISLVAVAGTLIWLFGQHTLRTRLEGIAPMLRASVPFAISDALTLVYLKIDVTIVASQLNERAAGLYAPAGSLISSVLFIPNAIFVVMVPVLSRLMYELEQASPAQRLSLHRQLQSIMTRLMVGMSGVGVGLSLLVWLSAGPLVRLFLGPDYLETGGVLQILGLLLLFKAGSYGIAVLLVAAEQQRQRVQVQAIAAAFNAGANLLIIHQFGIVGVAWVYVLTEALLLAGYTFVAWRWWGAMNTRAAAWNLTHETPHP